MSVLCFSETHLDPSIGTDTFELEGFDTPLRKDRSQHRGGVMVYISNSLKYERHEEFEDPRLESIWIEVILKMQKILICCFYRRNFNTSQSVFYFINENVHRNGDRLLPKYNFSW